MTPRRLALMAGLMFVLLVNSNAQAVPNTEIDRLSKANYWRLLGYYEKTFLGYDQSEVLDSDFFLHPNGKKDPAAELAATIAGVERQDPKVVCRFPARARWISSQLKSPSPQVRCPDLEKWKRDLDVDSLSIVIPTTSLESSLAVFSHTFLKIHSRHFKEESTLHTVIGYSAALDAKTSFLELAFRGLFGGYVGRFGTPGYYDELIHYGYEDTREIYEYRLNLTPEEIDQLLNHVWEIQTHGLRYYFLHQNCSYYMLTLLDIARPGLDLSTRFPGLVIPYQTIQEIYWKTNLVSGVRFVPSKETKRRAFLKNLTTRERSVYLAVVKNGNDFEQSWPILSKSLKGFEQVNVLDAYNQFLIRKPTTAQQSLRPFVLKTRAELELPSPSIALQPLSDPPHLGHGAHMMTAGIGQFDQTDYFQLRYRLSFHDMLNEQIGHNKMTSVEILDTRFLIAENRSYLQKLGLFEVLSLRPVDDEVQEFSWTFRSVFERRKTKGQALQPLFVNEGGVGYSFIVSRWTIYGLATLNSAAHSQLEEGYQAGAGMLIGGRWELGNSWNFLIQSWAKSFSLGEKDSYLDFSAGLGHSIGRSWELRLTDQNFNGMLDLRAEVVHLF